jgi:hypothetical protein
VRRVFGWLFGPEPARDPWRARAITLTAANTSFVTRGWWVGWGDHTDLNDVAEVTLLRKAIGPDPSLGPPLGECHGDDAFGGTAPAERSFGRWGGAAATRLNGRPGA